MKIISVPIVCAVSLILFLAMIYPAFADEGGPGVGDWYSWIDSNLPAPTEAYYWREIAGPAGGSGTEITRDLWTGDADDGCYNIPAIGFDFEFYGNTYSDIYVGTNGFVNFGSCNTNYQNEPIPTSDGVLDNYIGAFWNDLYQNSFDGATVYYQLQGSEPNREFVVEWYQVPHYEDASSRLTFQVVLCEGSNDIVCAYNTMTDSGGDWAAGTAATLGVEGPAGYQGLEYSYLQSVVRDAMAIRYYISAGAEKILLLQEPCDYSPAFPPQALNNLGLTYTVTTNPADFEDRLQNAGPWDLAIIDEYNIFLGGPAVSALDTYITGGGKAIVSYWGWYNEPGLDAVFNAAYASDYQTPRAFYRWDADHPIFTTPNSVPDFTQFSDYCLRNGAKFNAVTGGTALAGYTASEQADEHCIIIGNGDRTILNGEVFDVCAFDEDTDGKPDVVALIENEVRFLLPASPTPSPTAIASATPTPLPSATPSAPPTPPLPPTPPPSATPSVPPTPPPPPSATPSVPPTPPPTPPPSATPSVPPTPPPTATPAPSPSVAPTPQLMVLESGDYNGDGTSDIAIFRPADGRWAVRNVGDAYFGQAGDIPASGDYNGDGRTDVAIFRPSTGMWAVRNVTLFYYGQAGDIPVPADYDEDGKAEKAIFRPATGMWAGILTSGGEKSIYFGTQGDYPIPGNYNGDHWAAPAIFRPATGMWAVRNVTRFYFGGSGDLPVPRDYDTDGIVDRAIFRPATGLWRGILSSVGMREIYLGRAGDWPAPANYDGDRWVEPAIFRPAEGLWAIQRWQVLQATRVYFGTAGDEPVSR